MVFITAPCVMIWQIRSISFGWYLSSVWKSWYFSHVNSKFEPLETYSMPIPYSREHCWCINSKCYFVMWFHSTINFLNFLIVFWGQVEFCFYVLFPYNQWWRQDFLTIKTKLFILPVMYWEIFLKINFDHLVAAGEISVLNLIIMYLRLKFKNIRPIQICQNWYQISQNKIFLILGDRLSPDQLMSWIKKPF